MKILMVLAMLAILSGCTTIGTFQQAANLKGAQAADGFLKSNLHQLCNYPTIGSIERAFGDNPTKYREYKRLCGHQFY